MSYKCKLCGEAQKNGEPSHDLIIEKRDKLYHYKDKKTGNPKTKKGWEIVKEIRVCMKCLKAFHRLQE